MGAKHKASWTSSGFHTKRPEAANPEPTTSTYATRAGICVSAPTSNSRRQTHVCARLSWTGSSGGGYAATAIEVSTLGSAAEEGARSREPRHAHQLECRSSRDSVQNRIAGQAHIFRLRARRPPFGKARLG